MFFSPTSKKSDRGSIRNEVLDSASASNPGVLPEPAAEQAPGPQRSSFPRWLGGRGSDQRRIRLPDFHRQARAASREHRVSDGLYELAGLLPRPLASPMNQVAAKLRNAELTAEVLRHATVATFVGHPRPSGIETRCFRSNDCGPAAIAIALHVLGIPKASETIREAVNPSNTFTSHRNLSESCERFGTLARLHNNGSLKDLQRVIEAGNVAVVHLRGPHWEVVTGMVVRAGEIEELKTYSLRSFSSSPSVAPGTRTPKSFRESWSYMSREEGLVGDLFASSGLSNVWIEVARPESGLVVASDEVSFPATETLISGVDEAMEGVASGSPTRVASGVVRAGVGAPFAVGRMLASVAGAGSEEVDRLGSGVQRGVSRVIRFLGL